MSFNTNRHSLVALKWIITAQIYLKRLKKYIKKNLSMILTKCWEDTPQNITPDKFYKNCILWGGELESMKYATRHLYLWLFWCCSQDAKWLHPISLNGLSGRTQAAEYSSLQRLLAKHTVIDAVLWYWYLVLKLSSAWSLDIMHEDIESQYIRIWPEKKLWD